MDDRPKENNPSENGVWLSIVPVAALDECGDEYTQSLKIYLLNNTATGYGFHYELSFFGDPEFQLKKQVRPFEKFYIHDVEFEDMNDSPAFGFDFTLEHPVRSKADHFKNIIKIKPKQLFKRIEEAKLQKETSILYLLMETYPDKLSREESWEVEKPVRRQSVIYNAREARKHIEPARSVVDLHIEKLTDDYRSMSNFEMLTLQLKTFEKFYQLSVFHMHPHLVIIHGIGSGRLRDEIHNALRLKKEVSYFVNQYNPRYGYGATEIFFKYDV